MRFEGHSARDPANATLLLSPSVFLLERWIANDCPYDVVSPLVVNLYFPSPASSLLSQSKGVVDDVNTMTAVVGYTPSTSCPPRDAG